MVPSGGVEWHAPHPNRFVINSMEHWVDRWPQETFCLMFSQMGWLWKCLIIFFLQIPQLNNLSDATFALLQDQRSMMPKLWPCSCCPHGCRSPNVLTLTISVFDGTVKMALNWTLENNAVRTKAGAHWPHDCAKEALSKHLQLAWWVQCENKKASVTANETDIFISLHQASGSIVSSESVLNR